MRHEGAHIGAACSPQWSSRNENQRLESVTKKAECPQSDLPEVGEFKYLEILFLNDDAESVTICCGKDRDENDC